MPRVLLCLVLFFVVICNIQTQTPPTVQICSGEQSVCIDQPLYEICVTINIEDGFPDEIDYFEITWGDGESTIVPGSLTPPDQFHIYDLTDFFNTCQYDFEDITVRLDTYFNDGTSINSAFFPTFINPPMAIIGSSPPVVCLGNEVCFTDNSCPTENLELISWDYGDGTSDDLGCHIYSSPGLYTVTLTVQNNCDIDMTTTTVEVLAPATAISEVTDGAEIGTGNPYIVCLNSDSVLVTLNALNSDNATSYCWEVIDGIEGVDFIWIDPDPEDNIDDPCYPEQQLIFLNTGDFSVVLTTNNACDQPATAKIFFQVEGGELSLNPQEDGCVSLDYTPSPFIETLSYTLNGMPTTTFPQTLGPGEYIVEVMGASSICDNGSLQDTFVVLDQAIAMILTPDTTICSLDGLFEFMATPATGGDWRIDGTIFTPPLDPSAYAPGTYTITYGKEPCLTTDEMLLTIINANIDMPDDTELCIDGESETFVATPIGGTWSGMGVTPEGTFDPAIGVGQYTLYYEVENIDLPSCSNLDSFVVTVSELFVDFMVESCDGNTLCFALTEDSSDFTSISWDFGGTGSSTSATPCNTFPMAGTYAVSVTIINGACTATTSQMITIEPAPVAGFSLDYDNALCSPLTVTIDDEAMGSNLSYEWYLNGELFSEDANPGELLLEAFGQAESYELEQIVSNDCASLSQTETLIVEPQPLSVFGIDENQYCSGDTLLIANVSEGNPDSYAWYLNEELISTDSVPPIIAYQTAIQDTIELCLITTNSCGMDTLCTPIVILPTDVTAFFNTDPVTVCVGDSIQFLNFATLGVPVFYDFGDGNSSSEANPVYVYNTPGEYVVTQQAFGCGFDVFENIITVVESPVADWDNPGFGCPGESLPFINNSEGTMSSSWDFGDGTPLVLETSPTHSFTAPGTYEVCLTIFQTNVLSCSATLCQTVTINTPPVAGFIFTDSLCLDQPIMLTSEAQGTNISCDYSFGDGNFSDNCNPVFQYPTAGSYLITQTVTDNNTQCMDTLLQEIHIRPLPESAFTFMTMDDCFPDTIQFSNMSSLADSYLWDFGDGTTSSLTDPTHFYAAAGTYAVSLTAFIDGICSATISQIITIEETPVVMIDISDTAICAGTAIDFTNASTGPMGTVNWDFGDGFVAFEQNPSHTFLTPGNYTVSLTIQTADDCVDTAEIDVVVFPAVSGTATVENSTCNGSSDGAIDVEIISGSMPYSYNWSNGSETEDLNGVLAGTYILEVTDTNTCRWDTLLTITEPLPLSVEVTTTTVTCFGGADGEILLTNISGGEAPYEWEWSTGSTDSLVSGLNAATYELTLRDVRNCEAVFELELLQNDEITAIDSIQQISCFGEHDGVITIDSISGGTGPYGVYVSSDEYDEGGVAVSRFDSLGPAVYTVEIIDVNNCITVFDRTIVEPAPTNLNVVEDTLNMTLGETATFNTFFNAIEPSFSWAPSIDLDCGACPEPTTTPTDDRFYILTMTDQNGCTDQDTVVVNLEIVRDIYIPNTFTPNGDGRNDLFLPRSNFPLAIDTIEVFEVYDRWGGMMFQTENIDPNDRSQAWDGTFRGKKVAPGTYVYFIRVRYIDDWVEIFSNEILLVR